MRQHGVMLGIALALLSIMGAAGAAGQAATPDHHDPPPGWELSSVRDGPLNGSDFVTSLLGAVLADELVGHRTGILRPPSQQTVIVQVLTFATPRDAVAAAEAMAVHQVESEAQALEALPGMPDAYAWWRLNDAGLGNEPGTVATHEAARVVGRDFVVATTVSVDLGTPFPHPSLTTFMQHHASHIPGDTTLQLPSAGGGPQLWWLGLVAVALAGSALLVVRVRRRGPPPGPLGPPEFTAR